MSRKPWTEWLSKYPDSVDVDSAPLRAFYEAYRWVCGADEKELSRILAAYPDSKLAPLIEFIIIQRARDPHYQGGGPGHQEHQEWVRAKWTTLLHTDILRQFPSVTEECMTAWGHFPIAGARMGPIIQLMIADTYEYPRFREGSPMPNPQQLDALQKAYEDVLSYYPNRFEPKANILKREWTHVILPAYFAIIYSSVANGRFDRAEHLCDEVLSLPNSFFGDNGGGESHPEALLAKSTIAVKRKQFRSAEILLSDLVTKFRDSTWGFHGGGGDRYGHTVATFACENLPHAYAKRLIQSYKLAIRGGLENQCLGK